MGVNRLWHLLQASGRALELRQLSGSIVAIDVSIWMVRIIHGMAKAGVQNFSRGHLIGILTRIMYLLDNDIKPIFVFDGPAPVLKQRTLRHRQAIRNRSAINMQKIAERYVVKLMEQGMPIEEQNDEDIEEVLAESEPMEVTEEEQDLEIVAIKEQQQNEIVNLEYSRHRTNHPNLAQLEQTDFESLPVDARIEIVQQIDEKLAHHQQTAGPPSMLSKTLLQRYITNASTKERIRQVKQEALQQIENLKIQRLLDQDEDGAILKEYFFGRPDVQFQLRNINAGDLYLQLSDPEERKKLMELVRGVNKPKARKLKDYQIENLQLDSLREKVRKRYLHKQEDLMSQHEDEPEVENEGGQSVFDKYDLYDTSKIKNILMAQVEDDSNEQVWEDQAPFLVEFESRHSVTPASMIIEPNESESEISQAPMLVNQSITTPQQPTIPKMIEVIRPFTPQAALTISNPMPMIKPQQEQSTTTGHSSENLLEKPKTTKANPIQAQARTASTVTMAAMAIASLASSAVKPSQAHTAPQASTVPQAQALTSPQNPTVPKAQSPQQPKGSFFTGGDVTADDIDRIINDIAIDENLSTDEMMQNILKFQNLSSLDMQTKFDEVKFLLSIFGIPWVEAPGESEAQCAYLEHLRLVDFVVTDDSDAFLFGAKRVIKGLFDKGQSVEYYGANELHQELGLTRDKLIYLALFLGSDYTEGIRGVGIVNAMEIVEAFDSVEALQRFSRWASKADVLLDNAQQHYENVPAKERIYKEQHRNYKKYWELPADFPSQEVINAYLDPKLDKSAEKFVFGQPCIPEIEKFCRETLQWDAERVHSHVLDPLKRILGVKKQPRITDYFKPHLQGKIATISSRRIKEAVTNLVNPQQARLQVQSKSKRMILNDIIVASRKPKVKRVKETVPTVPQRTQTDEDGSLEEFQFVRKKHSKPT